ncbi:MAG: hypothetical protein FJW34_14165 [Acidobacteria bacterium]|nr:hypothetical protein [Acidobacteriota bacterium]
MPGLLPAQAQVPREVLLLARIRQKMADHLTRMPDYTCLETVERSTRRRSSLPFLHVDTVRVEVAHLGMKELYSRPGGLKFEESDLANLVGGGMTASGEFALHLRSIFGSSIPLFTYRGEEDLEGRRTVRYEYNVPQNLSGYRLRIASREGIVGFSGSFWADPETLEVVRLEVKAEDIPPHVPVLSAVTLIDYAKVSIGDSEALLPRRAELVMTESLGRQLLNRTEFTNCRQYVGESVVLYVESQVNYDPPPEKKKKK